MARLAASKSFFIPAFVAAAFLGRIPAPAQAEDSIHHHRYAKGERIEYAFEDTDTTFLAALKDGTIQAGEPVGTQEIRIPVSVEISSDGLRKMTISRSASYRSAPPGDLSASSFTSVSALDKSIPKEISYSYRDDGDALDHLQITFAAIRKSSEVGGFLFYKMEDVHQMQESAAKIPEGLLPGQEHVSPGHEREGLGGKFVAAPSRTIYQGTETFNGTKAAYLKVISLGHEFVLPGMKVYTNFFFTMHIGLEGPSQGLLLFGEGQETATVLNEKGKGDYAPQAILQRQFSIRLSRRAP